MSFVRKNSNVEPIVDTVFSVVALAKEDIAKNGKENVVDASIGSLFNEEGNLVCLESFYDHYNALPNVTKAKYAQNFAGNDNYNREVISWVFEGTNNNLYKKILATPGGTGAISTTFKNILDTNQTVILPDIAWGSYKLMCMQYNLNYKSYDMFEGNSFNINSFKETVLEVMKTQDKILVVINDPCHNPTGYSMTHDEWVEVIDFMNECAKTVPCVILNDIAYIDYAKDPLQARKYLNLFNNVSDDLLCIVAFSISKSCSAYGLRCGAAIITGKDSKKVDDVYYVFEKEARATWSNIPNAPMDNFSWVVTLNKDAYLKEKNTYIDLLNKRSSILINEANEINLPIYPYKEGFFVTLKIENYDLRDKLHQALIDNHIYTVKVNKGIRIAVCSLPVEKCYGLASKIMKIINNL